MMDHKLASKEINVRMYPCLIDKSTHGMQAFVTTQYKRVLDRSQTGGYCRDVICI